MKDYMETSAKFTDSVKHAQFRKTGCKSKVWGWKNVDIRCEAKKKYSKSIEITLNTSTDNSRLAILEAEFINNDLSKMEMYDEVKMSTLRFINEFSLSTSPKLDLQFESTHLKNKDCPTITATLQSNTIDKYDIFALDDDVALLAENSLMICSPRQSSKRTFERSIPHVNVEKPVKLKTSKDRLLYDN
ncbi:hypothetical protein RF11_14427 [Thelohanellus kitauei]|uniref:Uncharacterized protein n=1 Tax=Thelohanellus kitauei TaxID=669202 RepID=A0A0C2MDM8_THEKT|nr:hypothetical protein RF11_14427 [Thelohanellus kitauei]